MFFLPPIPIITQIDYSHNFSTSFNLKQALENKISISGTAYDLIGSNNIVGPDSSIKKFLLKNQKILVVNGKIKAIPGESSLSLNTIPKELSSLIIKTNQSGHFKIKLTPGVYTFFILKDDIAYNNDYDSNNYYKSYNFFSPRNDIELQNDSNLTY